MKERYYMGAASIGGRGVDALPMFETLEQAIAHVSKVVDKDRTVRYIVKVIAKIEVVPPPVKVTMLDEEQMVERNAQAFGAGGSGDGSRDR